MKTLATKIYHRINDQAWIKASGKWGGYLLKAAVSIAALLYIGDRLLAENVEIWEQTLSLSLNQFYLLGITLLLMPVNLGLEASKWKLMAGRYYPDLQFFTAFQAVLAGISTGIFTPNRVGEYAGRVMYLQPGKRLESVVFMFVDRLCQMGITLWTGTVALEYLLAWYPLQIAEMIPVSVPVLWGFRYALWAFSLLGGCLLLFPQVAYQVVRRIPFQHILLQKTQDALQQIHPSFLLKILGLSLTRYCVFTFQYYLLLHAFGFEDAMLLAFQLVGLIFLVKSVIPSISLTELGIRETVAIAVLGAFAVPATTAFASTFLLYLINIILPALIGLAFVLRIRLD